MLSLEYASKIISEIESTPNQERKRNAYKSYEIREGLLAKYVTARLAEMFPKSYMNYSVADYSILKKIVQKKAKAYKEAPIRSLENEADTQEYQELLKDNCFNTAMKEIDTLLNEHKYCALAVFPYFETSMDEVTEKLIGYDFIPMAPYMYDVVKNQKGETEVFVLSYPDQTITIGSNPNLDIAQSSSANEGDVRSYVFWTEKEHRVFKAKGRGKDLTIWEEVIIGNENGVNPYGEIPIIDLPFSYDPNYPVPSPLGRQTIELNALLSVYLQSGSMQVGQMVLKYPSDQSIETVTSGIFTGMKLPQSKNPDDPETTAEYISPNPDLAGHKESIMTFMNMILDEQGIQGNQVINPNETFSSGVDRMLASADVQQIIEENQEKYLDLEHEVFELVKKINEKLGGYKYTSSDLTVKFQKPKMMISDSEKLDNLKKKKDLGIFDNWELLIDYNPNLSEQEARAKLEALTADRLKSVLMVNDANN
jgi:hypothetical protein